MATIELSTGWINELTTRMLGIDQRRNGTNLESTGSATAPWAGMLCGSNTPDNNPVYASAMINIMQGVVPTDFSTLPVYSSRSSDVLVSLTTPYGDSLGPDGVIQETQYFNMVTTGTNPVIINTIYKNAIASGAATWFRWMVVTRPTFASIPDTMLHQIIGTVGVSGSGADLEMDDVNVVSGQPYRISSLRVTFPSFFTY